jgi:REP element-mobilizing transposase RayT
LLYHIVCPAKYKRKVFTEDICESLKEICIGIAERYEIHFVEIGVDGDHIHFMVQSVPVSSPQDIVQSIKSITGKEIFKRNPEVKKILWGVHFWTSGYYVNTVGRYGNEEVIVNYVKSQGRQYQQMYRAQLGLFD